MCLLGRYAAENLPPYPVAGSVAAASALLCLQHSGACLQPIKLELMTSPPR